MKPDDCGCKTFCEVHGRYYIGTDAETGMEFCIECASDGFSGELCHTDSGACDMLNSGANLFERSFMCEQHAAEHKTFCEECLEPKP